ncbi:MAG: hypothetical protein NTV49_03445 [Kiritimatiellaeota bacterium]|nr:hypothetical protein [Kiritimatiellota bacterium]
MQDNFDIRVVLDFSGGSHDSCLVSESIAIVERLLHASERSDLDSLTAEFRREIPIVAIDAAKYRIKKLAGHSLILTKAESGSIILTGLVGGLAVWVLSAEARQSPLA